MLTTAKKFKDFARGLRVNAETGLIVLILTAMMAMPVSPQVGKSGAGKQAPESWRMREGAAIELKPSDRGRKISPVDEAMFVAAASGRSAEAAREQVATVRQAGNQYEVFDLEFFNAAFCQRFNVRGASVFNRFERFADIFVPIDRKAEVLEAVGRAPGVRWIQSAGTAEAPPPPRVAPGPVSKEVPERIVRGGLAGLTGKGVIIAIVDSGLDFRNPDFITYDAEGRPTSRLLYLWDTTNDAYDSQKLGSKAPITYPNGASIGTLYTRDQLTAELRASRKRIMATDLTGHGTACAGIAAGNGNNAKGREDVLGVAPDADLIAVRVGGTEGGGFENSYLLGAVCGWLDSAAVNRPLVVSCSFGGHISGHDGARVSERQINARFPENAKGRAIVIAAGNEATDPIHCELKFRGTDSPGRADFASEEAGAVLFAYFDTSSIEDLVVVPADSTKIAKLAGWVNPLTEQAEAFVAVPPGVGGLFFYSKSGRLVKADIYIADGIFHESCASRSGLVGSPGTADNAITVGSYDWNDQFESKTGRMSLPELCNPKPPYPPVVIGDISCYSSPGYSRNGTIKPEIAAPGQYYCASYVGLPSRSESTDENWRIDKSGKYWLFNGTSAATPYVAGVVALMMQKQPAITLGEVRNLLRQQATRDRYTGQVPNVWWGYGKLDLPAAERMIKAIR